MVRSWLYVGLLTLTACTSPYKVHQLDDYEFVPKGDSAEGAIGLNGKSEVELKSETSASHDLAVQEGVNTHLEDHLRNEAFLLRECNHKRTGVYELSYEDYSRLKPAVDAREDFGTDNHGDLKHVHKEYYLDRLKAEQTYESNLRVELTRVSQAHADCLSQLSTASAQLPPAAAEPTPPPPTPEAQTIDTTPSHEVEGPPKPTT